MLLKNRYISLVLAISGLFAIPSISQAKDIENYEDYVSLFVSPGIGISQANIGDSNVRFLDDSRLTWQAKAGVSLPVGKKLSSFGQVRYASQFEENTIDFFGTEIGLNFEF